MVPEAGGDADLVLGEAASVFADLHGGASATVTLETDLAGDLGLDSLAIVELHDRLEGAFGVTLSEDVLATATTPGDWLRAILDARTAAGHPPALPIPPPAVRSGGGAWPQDAETLVEALSWHVERHSDLVSVRILGSHDQPPVDELTYRDLVTGAGAIARGLVDEGLGRGERVVIMLPTGRDYFVAFLGAILAGGVPVPIYPPATPSVLEEHLGRQALLLEDAGASVLIAGPEARAAEPSLRSKVPSLRAVRCRDELEGAGNAAAERAPHPLPHVEAGDIALIQYTSGSTSDPKGVVLSHAQVLANVRSLGQAAEVGTDDVFVSWLPLYHDMGLIGAWHTSLFFGFPLVLLSPFQFLARPASWLEAITANAGTLSAAPNIAYQSCVDRISEEEIDGLDLSSWRVAVCGSEPISALTLERFVSRFERCGFRRQAMCPAYGLAEVGVGLTLTPAGRGPRVDTLERGPLQHTGHAVLAAPGDAGTIAVVGCGTVVPGYQVRVADAQGRRLPDLREGRIQCRGPSATTGYFGNDAASQALWAGGWLDTGDLGYLRQGELFLTGRAKDLVIRGGRNLHPEDLEQALSELDDVQRDGVAVFASADPRRGSERIVAVVETTLEEPGARDALRALVGRTSVSVIGAAPDEIVLAPVGSILRTASLKIRRSATREAYEAGVFGQSGVASGGRPAEPGRWRRWASSGRRLCSTVASWAFGAYVWALVVLIGVPLWAVVQLPIGVRLRWTLARAGGRTFLALSGIDLRVHGTIALDGLPAVVVVNHSSFVDAPALVLALSKPVVFVTSSDVGDQRLIGSFLRRLGCIFVHRGQADRSGEDLERMVGLIRAGHHLVVFPEGSITPVAGLRPFHLGAFAVATTAGCPVVPIGIRGTAAIVRPGTRLPRHGAAEVTVGSPIMPDGDGFAGEVDLSQRTRRAVAVLSGQPEIDS
jgi:1-acyl-sn-glycerol-3-phosphate acyltransferase